jgi:hypothetical protein
MFLAHLAASDCLDDPLGVAEGEDTEDYALRVRTAGGRLVALISHEPGSRLSHIAYLRVDAIVAL